MNIQYTIHDNKAAFILKIRLIMVLGILTACIFSVLQNTSLAQGFDQSGLAVKPAIIDVTAERGKALKTSVTLQNISRDALAIEVGSRGLVPNDPEIDQSRRSEFDASLWIEPVQSATILDGGEQKNITLNIRIPENASPGGHYALITYRATPSAQNLQSHSSTKTNTEITTVALITVPGKVVEQAEVTMRGFPTAAFNTSKNIEVYYANIGNVHVIPRTKVLIQTQDGKTIETIQLTPELVLPNTIKTFEGTWSPKGQYGRFIIKTVVDFGTPNQTVELSSDTLYILPSIPTLFFWLSLILAVLFTAFTFWRWPDAARKAAGTPIRFVKRSTIREAQDSPKVNKSTVLKQVSIDAFALDELGKDRSLSNTKTRKSKLPRKQDSKQSMDFLSNKSTDNTQQYIKNLNRSKKEDTRPKK